MSLLWAGILTTFLVIVFCKSPNLCAKCDQNDYNPVCSDGRAYSNLCVLKRAICLEKVVPTRWTYGICSLVRKNESDTKKDAKNPNITFKMFGK